MTLNLRFSMKFHACYSTCSDPIVYWDCTCDYLLQVNLIVKSTKRFPDNSLSLSLSNTHIFFFLTNGNSVFDDILLWVQGNTNCVLCILTWKLKLEVPRRSSAFSFTLFIPLPFLAIFVPLYLLLLSFSLSHTHSHNNNKNNNNQSLVPKVWAQ